MLPFLTDADFSLEIASISFSMRQFFPCFLLTPVQAFVVIGVQDQHARWILGPGKAVLVLLRDELQSQILVQ